MRKLDDQLYAPFDRPNEALEEVRRYGWELVPKKHEPDMVCKMFEDVEVMADPDIGMEKISMPTLDADAVRNAVRKMLEDNTIPIVCTPPEAIPKKKYEPTPGVMGTSIVDMIRGYRGY